MERAEVERLVVGLVKNQLEGGSVFLEQSFEAQGGDELDAVEIVMELEERLNIALPDWSHIDLAEVTPGFLVDEVVQVLGEKAAASKPTPEAPLASVAPDVTPAVCQGTNCGALPGGEHSPECIVEAAEAQGWGDAPEAVEARAKAACVLPPLPPEQYAEFVERWRNSPHEGKLLPGENANGGLVPGLSLLETIGIVMPQIDVYFRANSPEVVIRPLSAEEKAERFAGFISEAPIDRNALARANQTLDESLRLIFPGDKMHLLDEFFALHQNSERLIGLIGSKEFLGLTEEEQTLLTQQNSVMSEYQNILMRRIDICAAQAEARMNQQQAAGGDA